MRYASVYVLAIALGVASLGVSLAGDPPEAPKAPVKVRPPRPLLEDAVKRCFARARANEDEFVARAMFLPEKDDDGDSCLAVVEFVSGAVGLYHGGAYAAKDQAVVIDKTELAALAEALARAERR